MKLINESVVGDVFLNLRTKKEVEVIGRDSGYIQFSDGSYLSPNDFPGCLKNFESVKVHRCKFRKGDVVNYKPGVIDKIAFVISVGKKMTLQFKGNERFTYNVPESDLELLFREG